ncbi:hypothetical protein Tco_0133430 [Tanacetum coccineum]
MPLTTTTATAAVQFKLDQIFFFMISIFDLNYTVIDGLVKSADGYKKVTKPVSPQQPQAQPSSFTSARHVPPPPPPQQPQTQDQWLEIIKKLIKFKLDYDGDSGGSGSEWHWWMAVVGDDGGEGVIFELYNPELVSSCLINYDIELHEIINLASSLELLCDSSPSCDLVSF